MGDLTEHFSWAEFACHDGTLMPPPVKINIPRTAEMLEVLRLALSEEYKTDCPLIVASGYRSPEWNKYVGGVANSQHLLGKAADIVCLKLTAVKVQVVARKLWSRGTIGGLGLYPGFTHVDWGPKRIWTYQQKEQFVQTSTSS